jgi:hypothetical protein
VAAVAHGAVRGRRGDGRRRVVPVIVLLLLIVPVLPSLGPGVRRARLVDALVVVVVILGAVDLVRSQKKQHSLGDMPGMGKRGRRALEKRTRM